MNAKIITMKNDSAPVFGNTLSELQAYADNLEVDIWEYRKKAVEAFNAGDHDRAEAFASKADLYSRLRDNIVHEVEVKNRACKRLAEALRAVATD